MERGVGELIDELGPRLVVELSAVRVISAAGVTALLQLRRRCLDAGGSFALRNPSGAVVDLLERVALSELFAAEAGPARRPVDRDDLFVRAPAVLDAESSFARRLGETASDCNVNIDTSLVTTCTAAGLRLLVDIADEIEHRGGSVTLRGPSDVMIAGSPRPRARRHVRDRSLRLTPGAALTRPGPSLSRRNTGPTRRAPEAMRFGVVPGTYTCTGWPLPRPRTGPTRRIGDRACSVAVTATSRFSPDCRRGVSRHSPDEPLRPPQPERPAPPWLLQTSSSTCSPTSHGT